MTKYGNVLRVAKLLRERQQLGTDTPVWSTELGVSAIIHFSAKGNSQHYKLEKQKVRFSDVQRYSTKGSEIYCSGYRITAILMGVK
jgi:hypothetical protein